MFIQTSLPQLSQIWQCVSESQREVTPVELATQITQWSQFCSSKRLRDTHDMSVTNKKKTQEVGEKFSAELRLQ